MRTLKDTELKLICELVKNSRRSDRELAKLIGVSQPTVSRIRVGLEKEGMLDYTAIPNISKLGFGIMAIVFGKRDMTKHPESHLQKAIEDTRKHPSIIFGAAGIGLGFDRIAISVHKGYTDYAKFIEDIRKEWAGLMRVESFLVDLNSEEVIQRLSFKSLVSSLIKDEQR